MDEDQKLLKIRFLKDVENISEKLLIAFGVKQAKLTNNVINPLLRWIDFRLRYIPEKPRKIYFSDKFPKFLPKDAANGLLKLVEGFQRGTNLNPYQGKGLKTHDISNIKKHERTDLLWADWGIHHFHLTDSPISQGNYFSKRSDWLLFCLIVEEKDEQEAVCMIDVLSHKKPHVFSSRSLIKIIADNWPVFLEKFELNDILPSVTEFTDEQIALLRKSGIVTPLAINNRYYLPFGLGFSTACTSLRAMMVADHINQSLIQVADWVNSHEFKQNFKYKKQPIFRLCITPSGLAIYEENMRKAFVLPRRMKGDEHNALTRLHDYLLPEWAFKYIVGQESFCICSAKE